jgi:hypothetical protein
MARSSGANSTTRRTPTASGPTARRDLELDGAAPTLVGLQRDADDTELGTRADQRRVACDPVRPSRGDPVDRLEQVRLALGVGSHEDRDAGGEVQHTAVVRADVGQLDATQEHQFTRIGMSR